jgi:hypothetical protein
MRRRWSVLAAAVAATVLLAAALGVVTDRLTASSPASPGLRSVSPALLAQMNLTVKPAGQAPYCGLVQAPGDRGWPHGVTLGCAVSRKTAEAAAGQQPGQIVESVLVRVSIPPPSPVGQDRLAWLVVVRLTVPGGAPLSCGRKGPIEVPCPTTASAATLTAVIVVDAYTGQVTTTAWALTGLPPAPGTQGPAPIPVPTAQPIPRPTLETG